MKSQAFAGSALVALSVATGSLLAPQAASALDFTFSFDGVTGLISGLEDDTADQVAGVIVSVLNSGITSAPLGPYSTVVGSGFTVSSGAVRKTDWQGLGGLDFILDFISNGTFDGFLIGGTGESARGPVTFIATQPSAASVPGPLPLFGAAAAFGFSRKLRKRINGMKLPVESAID